MDRNYKKDLHSVLEYTLLALENPKDELDIDFLLAPFFNKYGLKIINEEYVIGVIYSFLNLLIDAKNHSNKRLSDNTNYCYENGVKDLKEISILLINNQLKENNEIIQVWKSL